MLGNDNGSGIEMKPYSATLNGRPLSFPLDQYYVDLIVKIPFKDVTIQHNNQTYGDLSGWNSEVPKIVSCNSIQTNTKNFTCDAQTGNDPMSNNTFIKIHINFTRNDFAFWAIIFPILFIFFLLGTICFLGPVDHYLVARIAITLGVFAFVFTFDTMLPNVKPHNILNTSTFEIGFSCSDSIYY
ncbi:MAG: hypothetical protein WAK17_16205 [Candidatus Nitrosopolaris sp.]